MDEEVKKRIFLLAQTIDRLDYYQILRVKEDETRGAIRSRYLHEAQKFHPDNHFALKQEDPGLFEAITKIYKAVAEAYATLSHPKRRTLYTERLKTSRETGLRYSLQQEISEQRAERKAQENPGKTTQGNRFFQMAVTAYRTKNASAALMNMKMALNAERDNPVFKEWVERLEKEQSTAPAGPKDPKNPFKIG